MTPRRLIEPARLAGMAVLRTQTDDRLVDLVRDGNDSAFEAVVHRYRGPLLRYCARYLSPARAEDAVQQTFVNAVAALRDGDSEINLRPWLYRIAHNASLNVLRQSGADYEQISEQIDGVETPAQALERGERFRSVVAAVRGLPDRQRDALVLQALEGRSYDEIASELGVTGGAVRQLLNRARTTLREGATAFTPPALLARLGGALDNAPIADRVAQGVAGAGGGALLAKAAAVVAVAGAVAGGAVDGVLTHGSHERAGAARHAASTLAPAPGTASSSAAAGPHLRTVALKRSHTSRRSAATGNRGQAAIRSHRAPSATGEHRSGHSNHDDGGSGGSRNDDGSHHDGTNSGSDDSVATTMTDDHSGTSGGSSTSGGSDDSRLSTSGPDLTSGTDSSGSGSSGSGSDDGLTSGSTDGTSGTSGGGISGGRG